MIALLPVTEKQFTVIMQQAIEGYADECVAAARWPRAAAYEHAKSLIEADLPQGLHTPGHSFYQLVATETKQRVGYLWLEIMVKDNLPTIFISDIEIEAQFRRQGYAESTFKAVEQLAKKQEIERICLHVFRHNTAAQGLYKKLGFHVTGFNMLKNLVD